MAKSIIIPEKKPDVLSRLLPVAGSVIGGMYGGPAGASVGGAIGGALGNGEGMAMTAQNPMQRRAEEREQDPYDNLAKASLALEYYPELKSEYGDSVQNAMKLARRQREGGLA